MARSLPGRGDEAPLIGQKLHRFACLIEEHEPIRSAVLDPGEIERERPRAAALVGKDALERERRVTLSCRPVEAD